MQVPDSFTVSPGQVSVQEQHCPLRVISLLLLLVNKVAAQKGADILAKLIPPARCPSGAQEPPPRGRRGKEHLPSGWARFPAQAPHPSPGGLWKLEANAPSAPSVRPGRGGHLPGSALQSSPLRRLRRRGTWRRTGRGRGCGCG